MFEGYRVYGPYGKDRKMIALFSLEEGRVVTTMSYAKYLMSLKMGRIPGADGEDEVVDHIDDDRTNDVIENLQILTAKENEEKENRRRQAEAKARLIELTCPQCGSTFKRRFNGTHLNPKRNRTHTFCSRSCSTIFNRTGWKKNQ